MVKKASITLTIVDDTIKRLAESGHRHHLGASLIGHNCAAYLWYVFRWAKQEKFPARILRLFDRGHREEERFEKWLKDAGIKVYAFDTGGKQFRISDHFGHFGGSLDGKAINVPDIPKGEMCLLEYKTHGEKSFKLLEKKGMRSSKYQHFTQMQTYMQKEGLKYGLYLAINKNTDAIYGEIIELDEQVAAMSSQRAKRIIFSQERPARISQLPTWFECGYCSFKDICHYGDTPEVNCRTCNYATPVDNARWSCSLYGKYIPKKALRTGCANHVFLPDMTKKPKKDV